MNPMLTGYWDGAERELALHHFLEAGRENPDLPWLRIDRFRGRTVRPRRGVSRP